MRKIGFIGGGNMASAIYQGILSCGLASASNIMVYDIDEAKLTKSAEEFGLVAARSNQQVVADCQMIFLAVKPQFAQEAIEGIRQGITKDKAFISIMAGWTNERLQRALGECGRVLRVMPNTPLMVSAGMSALCAEHGLTDEEFDFVMAVFNAMGRAIKLPEIQFAAFSGATSASPAYVFMMIEALADAACLLGIPRQIAYESIAQAVMGSGKLALESGLHPGQLKDMVCSPGGSTIEGVFALEEGGFRAAVIRAIIEATDKFNRL